LNPVPGYSFANVFDKKTFLLGFFGVSQSAFICDIRVKKRTLIALIFADNYWTLEAYPKNIKDKN